MKLALTLFLTMLCAGSYAQNGTVNKDTLRLDNGHVYVKKSKVDIGKGSKADGSYSFLYVAPMKTGLSATMPVPLTAGWQGYIMQIVDFKLNGNDITGKKYYLVLTSTGKKPYYWCDPVLAVESGELLKTE